MDKKLYWILSFTWGILGQIAGFILWLIMLILGKKSENYKGSIRTVVGNSFNESSVSIGIFTFTNDKSDWISNHEFGHCIQNAIYGPLVFFIVYIPSLIDGIKCEAKKDWSKHNDLWFEKQATNWGSKYW